jgi:hypothetical protein
VSNLDIRPDATRSHTTAPEATRGQHPGREVEADAPDGHPDERRQTLVLTEAPAKPASPQSQGEKNRSPDSSKRHEQGRHNAAPIAHVEDADVAPLSERRPGRASDRRALAGASGGDDQPTVMVHIGRIDVRAVQIPPQSGSAVAQRSGLRRPSLDAYLQGRERRRP